MSLQLPPLPSVKWARDPITRAARLSSEVPRVPWDVFERDLRWEQGEHFGLIGATGKGKTTTLMNLLLLHPYVVVFATKPKDDTMDKLVQVNRLQKMTHWRNLNPRDVPRRAIWPKRAKLKDLIPVQKEVFEEAFENIYMQGGWTLGLDELWWYSNVLGLGMQVRILLTQARSLGVSVIAATQRPKDVPTEIYSQSTHLMFWRENDDLNLKRLTEINSRDSALIREVVQNLEENQLLYINTRTGKMLRTHVPFGRR